MSTNATQTNEGTEPLDQLDYSATTGKRAVYEDMEMVPGRGSITVCNQSHADSDEHTYVVQIDSDGNPVSCTCKAFQYHCEPGESCKHMARCGMSPAVLEAATPEAISDGGVQAVSADPIEPNPTTDSHAAALAEIVAQSTQFETLPDFDVFQAANGCIRDTIERCMEGL